MQSFYEIFCTGERTSSGNNGSVFNAKPDGKLWSLSMGHNRLLESDDFIKMSYIHIAFGTNSSVPEILKTAV